MSGARRGGRLSWFDGPDLVSGDQASARALGSSYLITSIIGRGSTGEVWRGTVKESGEPIAAKLLVGSLTRETEVVARFIRERAMLTRVSHPNVVTVRDLVVEGDTLAIVTDLVDGPSLRDALDRTGTLRPRFAVELCEQILMGLGAVHEQGLIHRDLKPENVLIERSPDGEAMARIVDFGIAQLAHGESGNDSGDVVGSAEYIAPELLEGGNASPASDLYALGIVLYELVCGRTPFGSELAVTVIRRQVSEPPGRPAGMPNELWKVLAALLVKDPAARPGSAAAALTLLAAARPAVASLSALPVAEEDDPVVVGEGNETIITTRRPKEPEPVVVPSEKSPRSRRSVLTVALGALLVIALALGGLVAFKSDDAGAASLTSATEFPAKAGSAAVHRTLTVEGGELVVTLAVDQVPAAGLTLVEYLPAGYPARNARVVAKGASVTGGDRRVTLGVRAGAISRDVSYRFRLRSPETTKEFLSRYEQKRVEALQADRDVQAPDAVVDASVASTMTVRANERAWLHVTGLTARRSELVTETSSTRHWLSGISWTSSRSDIAVVQSAVSDGGAGRDPRAQYPTVLGVAPGSARLTGLVAGREVSVVVKVEPAPPGDDARPRCETGIAPASQLTMTVLGSHTRVAEGTLLSADGAVLIAHNGKPKRVESTNLCAHASVVLGMSPKDFLGAFAVGP